MVTYLLGMHDLKALINGNAVKIVFPGGDGELRLARIRYNEIHEIVHEAKLRAAKAVADRVLKRDPS